MRETEFARDPRWLTGCLVLGTLLLLVSGASASEQTAREYLKEVTRLVPKIVPSDEKDIILERLAALQARLGNYEGARESVYGMQLNRGNNISRILVPGLIAAGRLDQAKELVQEIDPGTGGREGALASVAEAEARNGNIAEALSIVSSIDEQWASHSDALRRIATVQASAGDLDGALKTLSKEIDRNPTTLWDIVTPMAKAGDVEKALAFIAGVPQDHGRDYARWGVVRGRIAAGDLDGASRTAEAILGRHPKSLALMEVGQSEIESGKRAEGSARLQDAARIASDIPDPFIQGDALWQIASVQANAGDLEPALQTAGFIRAEGMRQHALALILQARADAGDVDGVRRTAAIYEKGGDDEQESYANCLIVGATARAGDAEGARKLIGTLEADDRSCALMVISIDRANADDITEALRTVHKMEAGLDKDSALLGIAASQARMGDVRGAVKTTSQIQFERNKGEALYQIAKIAASQDGPARDFRWAAKIKDAFQRASALLGLAEGMMAVTAVEDSK